MLLIWGYLSNFPNQKRARYLLSYEFKPETIQMWQCSLLMSLTCLLQAETCGLKETCSTCMWSPACFAWAGWGLLKSYLIKLFPLHEIFQSSLCKCLNELKTRYTHTSPGMFATGFRTGCKILSLKE